jgi:NAD(P)-dependent dehydrogenase (short-subunit alcohol dehydrogenase family)
LQPLLGDLASEYDIGSGEIGKEAVEMPSPMNLDGSVTIVTGGGSGIGRALTEAFAAAGAHVIVGDIDAATAHQTAELICKRGQTAVAREADASVVADIHALIDLAEKDFGPVDIYVANAGVAGPPGLGIDDNEWDRAITVNLKAHVRAATLLVPGWKERGAGYFVSIASAAGLLTQVGSAAYAVTKHAAVGFAEWLAIAYGGQGIGVSCVCPMGVYTNLLTSTLKSSDNDAQLMGRSIINAAEVIEPYQVASETIDAVRNGRFLVLPHPQVSDIYQQKGADYDGWIERMRQYRQSLASRG